MLKCLHYINTSFLRTYSRKLGQHPILAKNGTFLEKKGTKNFKTLQNLKALHNFHKRWQHPIAGHIEGLD